MRVSDIIAQKQTFSFEIFPPRGELPINRALEISRELAQYDPDWISVTFSAGGTGNSENTFSIAHALEHELNINALAHLTCMGTTVKDMVKRVGALRAAGIQNVLALRGDRYPGGEASQFTYASDLISFLRDMAPELCIGAACYPEGHVECEDLNLSMRHLYEKQEAGADYFVTQLFFDNQQFYHFRELCLRHRIKVPIVAGIMPFTSVKQIQRIAFTCGASIPAKVIKRLAAAGDDPADQVRAGMEYAREQVVDLAANGVDGIHIYSMNHPEIGKGMHDVLCDCGYLER